MAKIIKEQQMIEQNIFQYEERLAASTSRFLDKTPNFVTYYHVNSNETTVDEGFQNIEAILGSRSALQFQKIENFPLYGIDQIIIQLENTDMGLDGNFEDDAIILPNTLKPVENDFFIINHLNKYDSYLFRVISVDYDNIKSNNYYKIQFRLEYIDEGKVDNLNNQVYENYNCVLENIGTEEKCIIEKDSISQLEIIDTLYKNIASLYLTLYYNQRYNCLVGDMECSKRFYDPYLTQFVNKHHLFNYKNDLDTYVFNDELLDPKKDLKYERYFFRFIERRTTKGIQPFYYRTYSAMNLEDSIFARWNDKDILVIEPTPYVNFDTKRILSEEFIESINSGELDENPFTKIIQKWILNLPITIHEFTADMYDEVIQMSVNTESLFFIPVFLYIMKTVKHEYLKV